MPLVRCATSELKLDLDRQFDGRLELRLELGVQLALRLGTPHRYGERVRLPGGRGVPPVDVADDEVHGLVAVGVESLRKRAASKLIGTA